MLLNVGLDLAQKILRLMELREQLDVPQPERAAVQAFSDRLAIEQADLDMRFNRAVLEREKQADPPAPPLRIFQRTMDVVDTLLILNERRLTAAGRHDPPPAWLEDGQATLPETQDDHERIRGGLERAVTDRQLERIPDLVVRGGATAGRDRPLDRHAGTSGDRPCPARRRRNCSRRWREPTACWPTASAGWRRTWAG